MEQFIPGQRWISNAELSLGLGLIIDVDHRMVTVDFMAAGETRIYAGENAPLTRVIYDTGEQITTIEGICIKVSRIIEDDGLVIYQGKDGDDQLCTIEERQLDHYVQLNRPGERLFTGQIDKNHWFDLRYQTLTKINQLSHSDLSGLTGCRTSLIAHQLFIAHEVANRYAPRVLLADEVGLGKTIEAGLIIHHQLLNERARRVLIIVPESLMYQWLVEMLRRFNLLFSIFDLQRCQGESADNPFLDEQLVLCSLEFLTQNEQHYQQALAGEWDLLVVDEAHHLQWTVEESSYQYKLIEQLSGTTDGILLLTATPEQLGVESHFARLRLLDADRFPDLDSFIAEEQSYQPIAKAMEVLISSQETDQALNQETIEILKQYLPEEKNINKAERETLIARLLDRHGTGRVLFRNTRNTIKGFPGRQVIAHPQELPYDYAVVLEAFYKDKTYAHLLLFPEILYQLEVESPHSIMDWTQIDPRVRWLSDWLVEQRQSTQDKILVIAANAATAIDLANALKQQSGIVAAVFHEGLSLLERDRSAAFFADKENGSSVLICSEIGSEGRNFQFAHQMVLFDLPLNPDLLEQRIGRLDRIGQTQTIKIHVPYLKNTAQEHLFNWYHSGLNAFEATCPAGHNVFIQMQTLLESVLMEPDMTMDCALLEQTQALHKELNDALHQGRDRLLEYNSCRQPEADQLTQRAEQESTENELVYYMDELFDALGIEHSDHSELCYIIAPGEHMVSQFPGLTDDGMTITYDRATALANEDIQFFTWEHPMVRTAMDMISSSEMGNTAITTLDNGSLDVAIQAGSVLLECIFILETSDHQMQADRYLPVSTIRVLINEQGQDLSKKIKHSDIATIEAGKNVIKRSLARQIIKMKEDVLREMITHAEKQCSKQTPQILSTAREASRKTLQNEIDRLEALARINPNIRAEEVDFYVLQLSSLESLFHAVNPRLDAVRVIIVT